MMTNRIQRSQFFCQRIGFFFLYVVVIFLLFLLLFCLIEKLTNELLKFDLCSIFYATAKIINSAYVFIRLILFVSILFYFAVFFSIYLDWSVVVLWNIEICMFVFVRAESKNPQWYDGRIEAFRIHQIIIHIYTQQNRKCAMPWMEHRKMLALYCIMWICKKTDDDSISESSLITVT